MTLEQLKKNDLNEKNNATRHLNYAGEIVDIFKKTQYIAGWNKAEYRQLKQLLIVAFNRNLQFAKKDLKEDDYE